MYYNNHVTDVETSYQTQYTVLGAWLTDDIEASSRPIKWWTGTSALDDIHNFPCL